MSRIAFISAVENYFWGGSEELWSQVALRMAQQGVTVGANVTHNARTPEPLRALIDAGGAVTWRPDAGSSSLLGRASRHFQPDKIYRWLDSFQPDFAFISQGTNLDGYKWMRECARRKIPFVTVAQSASEVAWPHSEMATEIAEGYEAAQACFFVSRSNMELTRRQLARPLPNAQVVRNPFNVSYDAAPSWPASDPVWKLACVGRLEPNSKGQDILFEVLQDEAWRQRPIEVTLFGRGFHTENVLALKQMMGLEKVTYGGFTEDVESIWASHHALVLPSRSEGLPLVVVEAMLCGRPAIVTDVAGNAELLQDGVSGFVAAAAAPKCLAEAMERAWQRRSEWQEMGQAAALRVRKLVPRDPVETFLQTLQPLMPGRSTG